jgi:hypothetical protein
VAEPTLNVIYTRGTVRSLSLLVWSLLEHSDFRFRLVANGCPPDEASVLQRLAEQSPRCSFLPLPATSMMPHGQALNYLQAATTEKVFGFLDSDIFAVDRLPAMFDLAEGRKACFCYPATIARQDDDVIPKTLAQLSCTYLALYDAEAVARLIDTTGIGFDKYLWSEIPTEHRQRLTRMSVERPKYDTGQLLSLLLLDAGETPLVVEAPQLIHIGGFSRVATDNRPPRASLFGRLRRSVSHRTSKEVRSRTKHDVGRYFSDVLEALAAGRDLPEPTDMGDDAINQKVRSTTQILLRVVQSHGATARATRSDTSGSTHHCHA